MSQKEALFELQEEYLSTRSGESLDRLYHALRELAKRISISLVASYGIPVSLDEKRDIEDDATADFISKYLQSPDFRIGSSFYSYMRRILQVLYFRPSRKKIDKAGTVDLDLMIHLEDRNGVEAINRVTNLRQVDIALDNLNEYLDEEEIREVYPHVIQIFERPGTRDYHSYLYRIKNESTRNLVEEAMEQIREGIVSV